jgi:GYF domain 2
MTTWRSEVAFSSSGVHIREGVVSALNDPVWYISRDDQRHGPFTAEQFSGFEEAGTLRPTDQVWQTGMDAWIDYHDYVARKSGDPSQHPRRLRVSGLTYDELMRRGVHALTAPLTIALQSVSTLLARIPPSMRASSPAADASQHGPEGTAYPPTDPHPASIRPPLRAQEQHMRWPANGQIPRHPAGSVIDHHVRQTQDSATPASSEDLLQALRRSPSSIPRLANELQAAAEIGLDLATFRAWVAEGRLPQALPDCAKYDMKAIHLMLDRMSGIVSREIG